MKPILFGVIALVVGLGVGVAGRLMLAPPAPAVAAAPESTGAHDDSKAGTTPGATHTDAPETASGHDSPVAGGEPPHAAGSAPGESASPPAAPSDASGSGAVPANDYAALSQLMGKMKPAEVATLMQYLDDAQAVTMLESMPLRDVRSILQSMPSTRSAKLQARLLGSGGSGS